MRALQAAICCTIVFGFSASAQTIVPDTSGDAQLMGVYNFRQVIYSVADALGDLSREQALSGSITFDGMGGYTLSGTLLDSNATPFSPTAYSVSGTYGISASGQGTISGPLSSTDLIYGLVANGIFIGSSTQSNFNDLFIAAPVSLPALTAASFTGSYWFANLNLPAEAPATAQSAWFQFTADGAGGIGNLTVNGHIASNAATTITQSFSDVTYSFTNGVGTLAFPAATATPALVSGNETMYLSPDGNFIFGGSPTSWDMLIGVRLGALPMTAPSGVQYQAGLDLDVSQLASGSTTLAGYYGALVTSGTQTIGHQHLSSLPISTPYDFTYQDIYTANGDGSDSDPILGATYVTGAGLYRIGFDVGTALGINVALPAPLFSGAGVYLNPQGIVSAASSAPFTAGIAPGEFISIYGSGLASAFQAATALPLATTLGNVQVLINNIPAPISFVSPVEIAVLVPYSVSGSLAQVQVLNNGAGSNIVTTYLRTTAPGVFTVPAGGLGYGAVLHLDYSVVTPANPAQAGETLAAFVSGLGAVSPAVATGAAGPTSPLSYTSNLIGVLVDNQVATVSYMGLAPDLAGLYQLNFTVPASGIHSGDVYLGISGPDSLTSEAQISIAAGPGTIAPTAVNGPRH